MEDRIIKLIGKDNLAKIKKSKILLIGIGGVGSCVFELLVRSNFLNITIVDKDNIELSNLNRQIISTSKNIGNAKVKEATKRALLINPEIKINSIKAFLTEEDITLDFINKYDYIIDACDTVEVKKALLLTTSMHNKHLISCMGTANRLNPQNLEIIKLKDTKNDPLAKVLRRLCRDSKKAMNSLVVCSNELPKKQKDLGTMMMVPMASASLIVSKVVKDIIQ